MKKNRSFLLIILYATNCHSWCWGTAAYVFMSFYPSFTCLYASCANCIQMHTHDAYTFGEGIFMTCTVHYRTGEHVIIMHDILIYCTANFPILSSHYWCCLHVTKLDGIYKNICMKIFTPEIITYIFILIDWLRIWHGFEKRIAIVYGILFIYTVWLSMGLGF